jgi:hypothetical protein
VLFFYRQKTKKNDPFLTLFGKFLAIFVKNRAFYFSPKLQFLKPPFSPRLLNLNVPINQTLVWG